MTSVAEYSDEGPFEEGGTAFEVSHSCQNLQ